ncbi:MAG TPA: hypothetical protein VJA25_02565 [Dehalococcoidia bacterium]|nr:hypothetical protein [Dehalococcoidia bacterium]
MVQTDYHELTEQVKYGMVFVAMKEWKEGFLTGALTVGITAFATYFIVLWITS